MTEIGAYEYPYLLLPSGNVRCPCLLVGRCVVLARMIELLRNEMQRGWDEGISWLKLLSLSMAGNMIEK